MRTIDEYKQILELWEANNSKCEIARLTGIPRRTVRDCIVRFKTVANLEKDTNQKQYNRIGFLEKIKNPQSKKDEQLRKVYSYILGVYLGDGSIVLSDTKKQIYRYFLLFEIVARNFLFLSNW